MTADVALARFLRQHRWHARGTLLAWSGAFTFAGLAIVGAEALGWGAPVSIFIPLVVAALLLGMWIGNEPRLTPRRLAQALDEQWALRGRLESSVELSSHPSDWAAAQRADASAAILDRKPPGRAAWRIATAALGLAGALVVAEGLAYVTAKLRSGPAVVAATSPQSAESTSPTATPLGHIEWKSPDPEIRAGAVDEVPLTATLEASRPVKAVRLEISVNGSGIEPRPLEEATVQTLAEPGTHEILTSLYLDELGVKPFDLVGYRLVAELAGAGPDTTVVSPQQLIQIRAPQRDAALQGKGSEFPARLMELKSRQLSLLKQNEAFARLGAANTADASLSPENQRVAQEQIALGHRTDELVAWVRAQGAVADIVTKLGEAKAAMLDAAEKIAARENGSAQPAQLRALALLTQLEAYIQRVMIGTMGVAANPIPEDQRFALPSRQGTPAGRLEQLAEEARRAESELMQAGSGSGQAPPSAAQRHIGQEAGELAKSGGYDEAVAQPLLVGSEEAKKAVEQLTANDLAAALVPTAAARRAVETAVTAQDQVGRSAAVALLEEVRRLAKRSGGASGASDPGAEIRQRLREAATFQQTNGSAEAARILADLAQQGEASPNRRASPGARADGDFAAAAARAQVALTPASSALNRVIRRLRSSPSAKSGAGDGLVELELAAEEAQWLTSDPAVIRQAQTLSASAGSARQTAAESVAVVSARAAELADAIEQGRTDPEQRLVRRFNATAVDPDYREAIDIYFEQLSRAGRRVKSQGAKAPTETQEAR